jgi:hypothetical protein
MANEPDELPKEVRDRIFNEDILTDPNFTDATPQERPKAIILGGQPGAGKGSLAEQARIELGDDVVTIDPDALREQDPRLAKFRSEYPYDWSSKTHSFASESADKLLEATSAQKKNLVFDTTLSDGRWASEELIPNLRAKGYDVEIRVVASPKLESELGVDQRFTGSLDKRGYGRYVPEGARDAIYDKLPSSLDTIRANSDVPIRIFNREGAELYDSRTDPRPPGQALDEARSSRLKDPAITQALREGWDDQTKWHGDLPAHVRDIPNMDTDTQARLLERHTKLKVNEGVIARAEGAATVDEAVRKGAPPARAPIPDVEGPELGRVRKMGAIAGLGTVVSLYDAKETGDRISTAFAQDNPVAARSEATQFLARGAGGAAAVFAPAAAGLSGGPAMALVVADAYLLTKGFERLAERMDLSEIINQTDREGIKWNFNGRHWLRKDLEADLRVDGVDKPLDQNFTAAGEERRELDYRASMAATGQAIGKASPQNPFVQPKNDSDPSHLYSRDWSRSPETGQWSRMVADEVSRNEAPLWKPEDASPTRAAELDRQASQVIDNNIARGPAPIAAYYQIVHQRNGWDRFGHEPDAVRTALNPNTLEASDGNQYVRNAQGLWSHGGEVAQGNLAVELETTRKRLVASVAQHQAQLAEIPAWKAPTADEKDRESLREMLTNFDVNPSSEQFEAIYKAVERTRKAEGIDPAITSLGLKPSHDNYFSISTPIQHLQFDSKGVVRVVATTTVDIVPPKETSLSGAPHAIDVPSTQGLVGQAAVRMAVPAMSASGGRNGKADSENEEPLNETPPKRNGQDGQPSTTASVPPEFAPSQQGPRDIRDPQHEGNEAYQEMQHKVKAFEAQQGIAYGPHSDRMAASMLAFSVEKGLHYSEVSLEKNQDTGQVQLAHTKYGEPAQKFDVDLGKMSSQPIEVSSQRINEAVSKHYGAPVPALERTREQAQGLGELSFDDKVMFARIRSGTPGHISDDHVAQAMVAAKKSGMDANSVGQVSMVGDQIRVAEAGPAGRTAMVDVNSPAPPLQASVQEANTVNQQQVLAQQQTMSQQQTQEQGGPSGPTMGARAM